MGFLRRAVEHLPMRDASAPAARSRRGGILVVVALVVYFAGLVPNLRWRVQREGMRMTMVVMRELGNEIAEYRRRAGHHPVRLSELGRASPVLDGFGNPLVYRRDVAEDRYRILSTGADGVEQGFTSELFEYMDCDIVYGDVGESTGQFEQAPVGISMGTVLGPGWGYSWFKPLRVMHGAR